MSKFARLLLAACTLTSVVAPLGATASEVRPVSCVVSINYSLNGALRAPYEKAFVVLPGQPFEDDFSTFTRFRIFDASTRLEDGNTVVSISYFNDVGVFDSIDASTELTIRDGNDANTVTGTHTFYTSRPFSAAHRTDYTLTCSRLKD